MKKGSGGGGGGGGGGLHGTQLWKGMGLFAFFIVWN